jgi:hypothetical protein
MTSSSFKTAFGAAALAAFFLSQNAVAQRLQVQAHVGFNASEAFIRDKGQTVRETGTYFDTIPNAHLGLSLSTQLTKHFYLRLDGNYRAYRTSFRTEEQTSTGVRYMLGNLYNEKFNLSLLPEYRFRLATKNRFQAPAYVFAGPVMMFESGKNYQESYVFGNGSATFGSSAKPDAQFGFSVGGGINPKWNRWGLLFELRYTRFGYAEEGIPVGELAYEHFTGAFGLTVDIVK